MFLIRARLWAVRVGSTDQLAFPRRVQRSCFILSLMEAQKLIFLTKRSIIKVIIGQQDIDHREMRHQSLIYLKCFVIGQLQIQMMQQLSSRKESRPKVSEYKAMIQELLQQIKRYSQQNQNFKKQLVQTKSNMSEVQQKMHKLQQQKDRLQSGKRQLQQQVINEKFQLTLQLTNKDNQISHLRQENKNLNNQSILLCKEKNALEEKLSMAHKDNALLSQKLQKLVDEKHAIQRQMEEKEKYHQLQVQELRKINKIIKNNFQVIEKDYQSLLKLTEEQTYQIPSRKYSPAQRPIGKQSNKPKLINHNSSNPEMQEQLWKIKQQVSEQIGRINSSREQAVKGRVDKTLATIESILSTMSNRVYSSSDQE